MYDGNMVGTNFVLATLSLCLVIESTSARDVPAQEVDGEATTPLDNEAWTPMDIPLSYMTLSILKLESTSLTDSSAVLSLLNM
jgi:hypothetical protein